MMNPGGGHVQPQLCTYCTSCTTPFVLEVVAEKDLERGEDVVLNYGPLSNDILLLDYGFLMPNNVNDRVELRYDGQLFDTACLAAKVESLCSFKHPAPWQQQLLSRLKLHEPGSSQSVMMGGSELVEGRLLAAVRVMHAQDVGDVVDLEALQVWGQAPPLGVAIERNTIRTLIGLAMLALTSFPTDIEQDESDLVKNSDESSHNHRVAIQFRMLKKHLLLDCIKGLKARYPT